MYPITSRLYLGKSMERQVEAEGLLLGTKMEIYNLQDPPLSIHLKKYPSTSVRRL
jgi:hypothetical protein